jgi:hypothetical protein
MQSSVLAVADRSYSANLSGEQEPWHRESTPVHFLTLYKITTMKPTAFLQYGIFILYTILISAVSHEQVTIRRGNNNPPGQIINGTQPSSDSLNVLGSRNNTTKIKSNILKAAQQMMGSRYSPYKTGLEIPANKLGSHDEASLYNVTINGSWSVSSEAIALEPQKGLVNYNLKLENGKKYIVKLIYYKNHYGTLLVHDQLSLQNYQDISQDNVEYTLSKTQQGKKEDELTFIISPYIFDDYSKKKFTPGAEVRCYLQFSLTNNFIKETGKNINHSGDYNMNVFRLVVKEVDF